jgi:glycosyltransferase involved in cell wall biosynthesis
LARTCHTLGKRRSYRALARLDAGVIYIVSDFRGSYHYVVDMLREDAGAELIELDPDRRLDRSISKLGILRQITTPRLLGLRRRWTEDDAVLVIAWYVLPVLLLMRLRLLRRPRRLVAMATFVHDSRLRRAVNLLLRALASEELEFIVFSDAERHNLVDLVRIPPARVHKVLYRDKFAESDAAVAAEGTYIFTGGYSNRDYRTFFGAVRTLNDPVVAVASALSKLDEAPPNVDVRLDISWDAFEELIRGCALLVLPLRAAGEASGQNVLFRGIRHVRPVVATRHDSLVEYLGHDYPGFVPASDSEALRHAIDRGLRDDAFRRSLIEGVRAASQRLREQEHVEAEIASILMRPAEAM